MVIKPFVLEKVENIGRRIFLRIFMILQWTNYEHNDKMVALQSLKGLKTFENVDLFYKEFSSHARARARACVCVCVCFFFFAGTTRVFRRT